MTHLVLGGAPLGGLFAPVTDADAGATIGAAWDAGIRAFDTAPHYGLGLSEARLGRFLSEQPRDQFSVSTKVGRILVADADFVDGREHYFGTPALRRVLDYSADGVRRSLEDSLHRLGLDRVDQLLIHDPDDHWRDAIELAFPALDRLRAEGVVDRIGVGMNQVAMLARFVHEADLDCILVAGRYSLLDRSAAPLLALCESRGVDVQVAGVFNSGILAGGGASAPTYDYRPASDEVLARATGLAQRCAAHGIDLPAAAIQFAGRHSAVEAVVVGARSAEEIRTDVRYWRTPIPDALWGDLSAVDM